MQKRFTKKLKNLTMYEDTTLKRLKKTYLDTMVKKRQINDRLNDIEKLNASIDATEEKEKIINTKNTKTV